MLMFQHLSKDSKANTRIEYHKIIFGTMLKKKNFVNASLMVFITYPINIAYDL